MLRERTRPLVVRFGALGDMVILTVLIRHLHRRFGEPVDIVSSGGWTRPLMQGQPGVGELYLVGSRRWPYWLSREQQALTRALRERGPSATWIADHDCAKPIALLKHAGWQPTQWRTLHDISGVPGPHFCDMFLRFAYCNPTTLGADLPLEATDAYGQLHVAETQRVELQSWLKQLRIDDCPLILVQPGNKRTMRRGKRARASNTKYWPEARWAAVLQALSERHPDHRILLLGVPQEFGHNAEILSLAKVPNAINVANDLPIPRLMALAQHARGMISVDTGPAHLAAAVGCTVVTLFGNVPTEQYAPRGPGARVVCVTGMHNGEQAMLGIHPHDVIAAWESLVAESTEARPAPRSGVAAVTHQ